jgi:hypothetical protein
MSPRQLGKTQRCSPTDAATRLQHARKFLEVAQLAANEGEAEYSGPAASLAVLAGVAASDAACCKALGRRFRGQDHRVAADLLEQVEPGGSQAANTLRRLLSVKDTAHYGLSEIGGQALRGTLRQASDLVAFAEGVLRR